uniref:RNA-directed RNA polymerase n=1 Tax=Rhizoctonia solani barnavirus 1 TaxID=1708382 RepID=A0A0M4KGX8_9VIRU|nr:RNA-dependent RNA polymerase [Rhizoctonia solani barnavirus 1]
MPCPRGVERRIYDKLSNWRWPRKENAAVKKSLEIHAEGLRREEGRRVPSRTEREAVLKVIREGYEYPNTRVPAGFSRGEVEGWAEGRYEVTVEDFESVKDSIQRDLNKDSTPGYPYVALGGKNKQVMENYGSFIWNTVAQSFNNALRLGDKVFSMSPSELVKAGVCDVVKVFIKDEPHSLKKIESGKLRLISSVSLVDQIKTRLLCRTQNLNEIESWESCPSKPGLGLHDDGLQVIAANIKRFLSQGVVAEADVSGWDWSVQDWELEFDAECRAALAGADPKGVFAFLLRVHAYCVANSVYVLPNGEMYEQTVPGAQLSGDYNTSSTNSRMRVCASLFSRLWAGKPLLVDGRIPVSAMGDDSFELDFPELQENMRSIGHNVRFVKRSTSLQGVEFCSQVFDEDGFAAPADPSKTVYRFLSHKVTFSEYPELWAQLSWYLRHQKKGDERDIISGLGFARIELANKLNGFTSTEER